METAADAPHPWYSPALFEGICWTPEDENPDNWTRFEVNKFKNGFRDYLEQKRASVVTNDAPNHELYRALNALRVFAANQSDVWVMLTMARFLIVPDLDPNAIRAAVHLMMALHGTDAYRLVDRSHIEAVAAIPSQFSKGRNVVLVDQARVLALTNISLAPKISLLMRDDLVQNIHDLNERLSLLEDIPLSLSDGAI